MHHRPITAPAAAVALALILGGCATPHAAHHAQAGMDPQAMCEMHRKMTGTMTAEQEQRMLAEHMKDMSPDMRARMQEMHARCR